MSEAKSVHGSPDFQGSAVSFNAQKEIENNPVSIYAKVVFPNLHISEETELSLSDLEKTEVLSDKNESLNSKILSAFDDFNLDEISEESNKVLSNLYELNKVLETESLNESNLPAVEKDDLEFDSEFSKIKNDYRSRNFVHFDHANRTTHYRMGSEIGIEELKRFILYFVHSESGSIYLDKMTQEKYPDIKNYTPNCSEKVPDKLKQKVLDPEYKPEIKTISNQRSTKFQAYTIIFVLRGNGFFIKLEKEKSKKEMLTEQTKTQETIVDVKLQKSPVLQGSKNAKRKAAQQILSEEIKVEESKNRRKRIKREKEQIEIEKEQHIQKARSKEKVRKQLSEKEVRKELKDKGLSSEKIREEIEKNEKGDG